MTRPRHQRLGTAILWAFAIGSLAVACDASDVGQPAVPAAATVAAASTADAAADSRTFRAFSLTIYGYNYTDTEIGSFEVNGRGGGNLAVSTRTSPGGSATCCAAIFTPLPKDRPVTVKWTRDGDNWCEQDILFTGPVPMDAKYLEVHFYQDGRIELAATPQSSPPRIKLERLHGNSRHADMTKNVINDSKLSRCKRGYF